MNSSTYLNKLLSSSENSDSTFRRRLITLVTGALPFAQKIKEGGENKKTKEKESAVIVLFNNKITRQQSSYDGRKKPEPF
jgi:hypothetical protein